MSNMCVEEERDGHTAQINHHQQMQEQAPLASQQDSNSTDSAAPIPPTDITFSTEFPAQDTLLSPADQYAPVIGDPDPFANAPENASLNLDFQSLWEESMEGVGSTGTPHKKAAVLMISWVKELDELDTGPEVKELASIFKECFRYDVMEVELGAETPPKYQLMAHLANFMGAFASPGTLLIVYYAGHGLPGQPGELYFTSKKTNKQRSENNSIPWHRIEPILQSATEDILLIFDCCYAGILDAHFEGRGHWATRSFELLAACKHDAKTHPPGPKSFTRALIWALSSLLKDREKFSTHELQMRIPRAKGFPKDQVVRIIDRGDPSDHRLVLAPVPLHSASTKLESAQVGPPAVRPKKFIDLRFWYTKCPNEEEVNSLSTQLKHLIQYEHIKADRVGWVRLGDVDQLRTVVEKWKQLPLRKSKPTLPRLTISSSSNQSHHHGIHTPPPSISSVSDAHFEITDTLPMGLNAAVTLRDVKNNVALETEDGSEIRSLQIVLPIGFNPWKRRLANSLSSKFNSSALVTLPAVIMLSFLLLVFLYLCTSTT